MQIRGYFPRTRRRLAAVLHPPFFGRDRLAFIIRNCRRSVTRIDKLRASAAKQRRHGTIKRHSEDYCLIVGSEMRGYDASENVIFFQDGDLDIGDLGIIVQCAGLKGHV